MLNPSQKKTKSAPESNTDNLTTDASFVEYKLSKKLRICLLALALVAVLAIAFGLASRSAHTATLRTNDKTVQLEIASTLSERQKGLGGRTTMADDQGMLFVLPMPAKECFWMKGMQFPLDIIWTDSNKRVVYVQQRLSPASYPKAFCPNTEAKYVIELTAGQAIAHSISVGQTLQF